MKMTKSAKAPKSQKPTEPDTEPTRASSDAEPASAPVSPSKRRNRTIIDGKSGARRRAASRMEQSALEVGSSIPDKSVAWSELVEFCQSGEPWPTEADQFSFEELSLELPSLQFFEESENLLAPPLQDLLSIFKAMQTVCHLERQRQRRIFLPSPTFASSVESISNKKFSFQILLRLFWVGSDLFSLQLDKSLANGWTIELTFPDCPTTADDKSLKTVGRRLFAYQKMCHDKFLVSMGREPLPYAYLVNWHPKFVATPVPTEFFKKNFLEPLSPLICGNKQVAVTTPVKTFFRKEAVTPRLSKFPPTPDFAHLTPVKTRPIVSPQTPPPVISPLTPQMERLVGRAKEMEGRKIVERGIEKKRQRLASQLLLREDCVKVFEAMITLFLRSDRQPMMEINKLATRIVKTTTTRIWDEDRVTVALREISKICGSLVSIKPGRSDVTVEVLHYNRKSQLPIKDYKIELVKLVEVATNDLQAID